MANHQEARPKAGADFVSDKVNFKIEGEDGGIPNHSSERTDLKKEQELRRPADGGDEQAEVREVGRRCKLPGTCFSVDSEDEYGSLFSQYSSTLYDVAMEAVTQSLLSGRGASSRKKSPAWKHFFISPRDSTKAVCMYCMKEFSRGKNEKDLSTSCLMRHVRRAHPTALLPEDSGLPTLASLPPPSVRPPPQSADAGDLGAVLQPQGTSTVPSPRQTAEDPVSAVSSEDASSDVPLSDQCSREDALGAPPHLPTLHGEEAVESGYEKTPAPPKGTSGSRRRSAVWKHFYLSPLDSSKAVCVHCMNEFSRGKNGKDLGTSCLIRHMWRAHRSIVLQESGAGPGLPPPYSAPPTLLPTLPLPDGDPHSTASSPGKLAQESPSACSSPDQLPEDLQAQQIAGEALGEEAAAWSSSDDVGEALLASSPEKQLGAGPRAGVSESEAVFQQNKKIMKRLKSGVWHHFSLAPTDSLKAVCKHCACVISRGKKGDVGTSCLMRHLYRRHAEVVGNKGFLGVSLANSPYATLASAESSSSKLTDLPTVVTKSSQVVFPVNSKKTSKLWNHFSICSADPTKVVCLHCGRTISRGKKPSNLGTSCLLRHLQRFHSSVLQPEDPRMGGRAVLGAELVGASSFDDTSDKFYDSHPVAKKITMDCDYSGSSVQKQLECWWEAWVTSPGLQVGITVTDNPSIGRTLNEGEHSSVQCFSHTVSLIVTEAIKSQRMWEVMQSVCHALKPFDAASREMSAHVSTLSQVIPMIHILNRKVEMLFEETTGIDAMLRSLKEAMVSRLSAPLHDPRYIFATLLDPRYKASLFSEEEAEQYKQELIRELETLHSTSEDTPVPNGCDLGSPSKDMAGEENLWSLVAKMAKKSPRGQARAPEDVVLAYLEEDVLEHSCDPLAYWNLKRAAWPGLSTLAVRFLGCPPSIVPSEKLFNTPTENGSFGQSRLMMEHFEKLIFLKVNLPLIYFQY
ncbi:hypothetical protein MC885_013355 [Smutsia gigantea]|nr:hypothetical protein MC885_013355 [Smutsia gigantea]